MSDPWSSVTRTACVSTHGQCTTTQGISRYGVAQVWHYLNFIQTRHLGLEPGQVCDLEAPPTQVVCGSDGAVHDGAGQREGRKAPDLLTPSCRSFQEALNRAAKTGSSSDRSCSSGTCLAWRESQRSHRLPTVGGGHGSCATRCEMLSQLLSQSAGQVT